MTQPLISVITTKLRPPQQGSSRLPRHHLLRELGKRQDASVALVMGPAGYGKTTLLAQWYEQLGSRGQRCSWLTLDEQDNLEPQFLSYLFAGFKQLAPNLALFIEEVAEAEDHTEPQAVIAELINTVAASPDQFALFLDDYHWIDNEGIHDLVQFLLSNLPSNLNLYIGSRVLPPFSLARLKVQNRILLIGSEMLRFDADEASCFMQNQLNLTLSPTELEQLYQRTQGWPAALQLATPILSARPADRFLEGFSGSQDSIAEYLAEEVFSHLPAGNLRLLTILSLFDRFSPALAEALLNHPDGRRILEDAPKEALLLQRFEGSEEWYQFHPLARGFLSKRLHAQAEPLPPLHQAAARWFASHGYIGEAVKYSLEAGDNDSAFALLETHALNLVEQGHFGLLANLVQQLPQGQISSCQQILIPLVWTRMLSHDFSRVYTLLEQIDSLIAGSDEQNKLSVEAEAATIRAGMLALHDQFSECRKMVDLWLPRIPGEQLFARATLINIYSWVLLIDYRFDEVLELQLQTEPIFRQLGNPGTKAYGLLFSALAFTEQMRLHEAEQAYQQVLRTGGHSGPEPVTHQLARLMLGCMAYLRGDQPQALHLLETHLETLRQHALNDQLMLALPCLVRLYQRQGHWQQALTLLTTTLRLATERKNIRIHASVLQEKVRLLLSHDPAGASQLLEQQRDILAGDDDRDASIHQQAQERIQLAEARVRLHQGDYPAAHALLSQLLQRYQPQGRLFKQLIPRLLLAQLHLQQHETTQAQAQLQQALALDPEGLAIQLFIDDGEPLRPLLNQQAQEEGPYAEPCQRILAELQRNATDAQPGQGPDPFTIPTTEALLEPLTKKETAVLRLVAEGLSNREVADRSFVSIETIKTHLKSIYSKMGVARRTQAVNLGRDLGLIE